MKGFFVLLCLAVFSSSIFAQNWASSEGSCFEKGNFNISAGLGIGWFGLFAIGDYAINDVISAGVSTGYQTHKFNKWWRYHYIPVMARATFHPFNLKVLSNKIRVRDKLDVYAGLATGWSIGWASEREEYLLGGSPNVGHFTLRELIGARFYPTSKFYLLLEESGGLSWINLGIGFKY